MGYRCYLVDVHDGFPEMSKLITGEYSVTRKHFVMSGLLEISVLD